jgi:hypothetical protein
LSKGLGPTPQPVDVPPLGERLAVEVAIPLDPQITRIGIRDEYTKAFTGFDTTTINPSGTTTLVTMSFTVPKGATSS